MRIKRVLAENTDGGKRPDFGTSCSHRKTINRSPIRMTSPVASTQRPTG
jgi:hypothetical protein